MSIRQNYIWMMVSNLVFAASQWGLFASAAKLGQLEDVGTFSLALAITGPVMLCANLNLRTLQTTDIKHEYRFKDYLGLRLVCSLLATIAVAIWLMILKGSLSVVIVVGMVTVSKIFDLLSDTFYGVFQQADQMQLMSISRILQGILQVSAFGIVMYLTKSITWASVALAISSMLVTLFFDIRLGIKTLKAKSEEWASLRNSTLSQATGGESNSRSSMILWKLFLFALPLGLAGPLMQFQWNIPRYFLNHWQGEGILGIFTLMSYMVIIAGTFVTGAAVQASMLYLSTAFRNDMSAFIRLVARLIGFAAGFGLVSIFGAWAFGSPVLSILYKPEYGQHSDIFVWLMIGALPFYVGGVCTGALAAARVLQANTLALIVALIVTVVTSALFIPSSGMLGAAWSWLLGTLSWCITLSIILYRVVSREIRSRSGTVVGKHPQLLIEGISQ